MIMWQPLWFPRYFGNCCGWTVAFFYEFCFQTNCYSDKTLPNPVVMELSSRPLFRLPSHPSCWGQRIQWAYLACLDQISIKGTFTPDTHDNNLPSTFSSPLHMANNWLKNSYNKLVCWYLTVLLRGSYEK